MKKLLYILCLALIASNVQAQKMFEQQFSNCPLKFVLEDDEYLINYAPDDSVMVLDFLEGMEEKQLNKLKGVIMIQVMVDTASNICCVSYTNKSTISDKKLDIPERIKQMNGWQRLPSCNVNENICALVSMVFDQNEIQVLRTGYNRNKGRKIMHSTVYQRNKETDKNNETNK